MSQPPLNLFPRADVTEINLRIGMNPETSPILIVTPYARFGESVFVRFDDDQDEDGQPAELFGVA